MENEMGKKVYIENNREGTVTTATIALGTDSEFGLRNGGTHLATKGDLIVEYYDFSQELRDMMNTELSYTTLVSWDDKPHIVDAILSEGNSSGDEFESDDDWKILHYLQSHFHFYQDVRTWLMNNRVPFRMFVDLDMGTSPEHVGAQDAEQLARIAHSGQKDKAGADYIEHPLRVAQTFGYKQLSGHEIDYFNADTNVKIVALLHDALEDTWVTREYLQRSGYPQEVINAIEALTKLPDEEGTDSGYEKFVRRAAQNPLAKKVKIADIRDNMDLSRIPNPSVKDHARIAKYQEALDYLEGIA